MKSARLFSIVVFAIMALYGAVGLYSLPLANFEGDLTRMGLLPESMFGRTKPQPAIDPALIRQASWESADVFVVGDSFSMGQVWQSELVRHGLRVRTEHWNDVRAICEDFSSWLRGKGFRGKYVIFESIENWIGSRVTDSIKCRKMDFHTRISSDKQRRPPPTTLDLEAKKYAGRISIGPQVWLNASRYRQLSAQPDFNRWQATKDVVVKRMANGCELFSHPQCQDVLFLSSDKDHELNMDVVNGMRAIDQRLDGLASIWVVIPNKSTAYLDPDRSFWDNAARAVRSVNVLKIVRRAIDARTTDLYLASDIHFSTSGYLLMGKEIYSAMQH